MSKWANWHLVSVDPLAQSFTWEDQFLKAASCTKVSVWLLGHVDFFFFFAWFYWAGLGRILPRAIKNTCFLVNFSPIHTLTELGFSGNISVEKLEQQLGSFSKQPSSLICLEILILSSQRFDLRPDFISSSAWQLSNLSFSAVEFHDLDT